MLRDSRGWGSALAIASIVLIGIAFAATSNVAASSGRVAASQVTDPAIPRSVTGPTGIRAQAAAAADHVRQFATTGEAVMGRSTPLRFLIGQRFVVAMNGTVPSAALLERARRGEIGGVILFGANVVDQTQLRRLTASLQLAARTGGQPPLLIATDQEGDRIRRVPWAGPALATDELGRLDGARLQAEGAASGRALRAVGINLDLAPVADVPGPRSFMALEGRTFGSSPDAVGRAVVAFAQGLAAERVAATVKHFPGIGRATRNTDRTAVEIAVGGAALAKVDLVPFRASIRAGVPVVMISNATYPALDSKPAPWSTAIQRLLRRDLGFSGATITDALEGAARTRGRTPALVASLAIQAGVDFVLLTGSEAASAAAYDRALAAAQRGAISERSLRISYDRILALKRAYG